MKIHTDIIALLLDCKSKIRLKVESGEEEVVKFVEEMHLKVSQILAQKFNPLEKNISDFNYAFFIGELSTAIVSFAESNFIQMQYSDWDCGLASAVNVSNGNVNLESLYPIYFYSSQKKGISTAEVKKITGLDFEIKDIFSTFKKFNFNNYPKGILLCGDNLKYTRKNSHYICFKDNLIFDSEEGIFKIDEYSRFKYILKALVLPSS